MNGVRSIFMRKGYWLTALAAAVLLVASSGTASAQVSTKAPAKVAEGESITVTATAKAYVPAATTTATTVTVTVAALEGSSGTATAGEREDLSLNLGDKIDLVFPANRGTAPVHTTVTGTLTIQTIHDPDAEDEDFTWTFTLGPVGGLVESLTGEGEPDTNERLENAATGDATAFTIDDDETQTYVLAVSPASQKPAEGTGVMVSLSAMPKHEDGSETLTVNIDKPAPAYTLTGLRLRDNQVEIDGANDTDTLTVLQVNPDGNRASDTVTLTAYSGRAGALKLAATLAITLADLHALPAVTAMVVGEDGKALDPQPESVTEGESVMIKVMVLTAEGKPGTAAEALKVELVPSGSADARDYELSIQTLDIASGGGESSAITLMAELDEDVGMEMLVLSATVSGEKANGTETSTSDGVLSLYIDDATDPQITPKSSDADYDALMAAIAAAGGDDGVNPGDTVTLMTSDLFDVAPGYTASYSVSVEGDSVSAFASGEVVTINAEIAGESKITVTGTASMSTTSLMPSQTVSNVASLTFPVMVVDTELVVTLSAEPMEIAAGGTTMITATANRAVTAGDGDVEIALTVVGDGTLDAESIMIAMGDMSGSATLTANESVTVVATGSGVTGLMQVAVTVTAAPDPDPDPDPDPEPVPALPLIAQWLLGLGLMGGGVRQLFRRRRQGS